jgi:thiamine biosynthesis lipoprotein ApbE
VKFRLFILAFVVVSMGLAISCKPKPKPIPGRYYTGMLLNTPYEIDVVGDSTDYQPAIDSIFHNFEVCFSQTNPNSVMMRYNAYQRRDSAFAFYDTSKVFGIVYDLAMDFRERSLQYYDPTTNPLKREWLRVNMSGKDLEPNLDSLYAFVGFDGAKMDLNEVDDDQHRYQVTYLRKADPRIEADFTNLACAYAMDMLGAYLDDKKVPQYRIKHGSRILAHGAMVDSLNTIALGISGDDQDQKMHLLNRALVYKGPREKQQMVDITYGYPVENEIMYSGVSARTVAESEVFSEAFMIMGFDAAAKWYEANEESDVQSFMVLQKGKDLLSTASTEGFDKMLVVPDSLANQEAQEPR